MSVYFENIVAQWLMADGRTLITEEYPLRISHATEFTHKGQKVRWPDILAVRPKDKDIFLCEVTWLKSWSKIQEKIEEYSEHEDKIRSCLEHWLGIGDVGWDLKIWYFVPSKHTERIQSMACNGLLLKTTTLEEIKPWTFTWGFRE